MLIFLKATRPKFEITILFSVVENSNNCVFADDLIPHSPQE